MSKSVEWLKAHVAGLPDGAPLRPYFEEVIADLEGKMPAAPAESAQAAPAEDDAGFAAIKKRAKQPKRPKAG